MALPSTPSLLPRCSECMRRYAWGLSLEAKTGLGSLEHIRGKRKSSRKGPTSLPVRLCKDVPAFGPRGTIVAITAGRMRNMWYPNQIAEYMTPAEVRGVRAGKITLGRDWTYGKEVVEVVAEHAAQSIAAHSPGSKSRLDPNALTLDRQIGLFETLVPKTLEFHRQVIVTAQTDSEPKSNGPRTAAEDLLQIRLEEAKKRESTAIYGSVSIQDVYNAIRAVLDINDEASKVVLNEEDIRFSTEQLLVEDASRVKHIGTFAVDVSLKGATAPIRRTVKVLAQET